MPFKAFVGIEGEPRARAPYLSHRASTSHLPWTEQHNCETAIFVSFSANSALCIVDIYLFSFLRSLFWIFCWIPLCKMIRNSHCILSATQWFNEIKFSLLNFSERGESSQAFVDAIRISNAMQIEAQRVGSCSVMNPFLSFWSFVGRYFVNLWILIVQIFELMSK